MENVPGIVGFGAAAEALSADGGRRLAAEIDANTAQIDAMVGGALAVGGVRVVGDPVDRLPHLVSLGIDGVEAEPVLMGLDRAGIAVHSGSACSSESLEPSPVLEAMGADPEPLAAALGRLVDRRRRRRRVRRRVRAGRHRAAGARRPAGAYPAGLTPAGSGWWASENALVIDGAAFVIHAFGGWFARNFWYSATAAAGCFWARRIVPR